MSTKEVLLDVAERLPPDATLVDAIHELEFRQAVEDGLASLDSGERIPTRGSPRTYLPNGFQSLPLPRALRTTWSESLPTSRSMML